MCAPPGSARDLVTMETSRRAYLLTGDQASLQAGLRTKLRANLPVAWGRPRQVEQKLTSRLGNAIKYSPGAARSSSPWTWMATRCS